MMIVGGTKGDYTLVPYDVNVSRLIKKLTAMKCEDGRRKGHYTNMYHDLPDRKLLYFNK